MPTTRSSRRTGPAGGPLRSSGSRDGIVDRQGRETAMIEGPVERVAVIGAGIAGLSVASALTGAGVDCVVLEARDRIGGRLHTVDLLGVPVDLGGSWIHHTIGNPLTAYVDAAGVAHRPGDPLPTLG